MTGPRRLVLEMQNITFTVVHYAQGVSCQSPVLFSQNWTGLASIPTLFGALNVTNCNTNIPAGDSVDNAPIAWNAVCTFQNLAKGELMADFWYSTPNCIAAGTLKETPKSVEVGLSNSSCYAGVFSGSDIRVLHSCPDYPTSSAGALLFSNLLAALILSVLTPQLL